MEISVHELRTILNKVVSKRKLVLMLCTDVCVCENVSVNVVNTLFFFSLSPPRPGSEDGRVQFGVVQVHGGPHGCIQQSLINKLD